MGIRTPVSSNYAITLGGLKHGVTPLDLAHAYETLATGGLLVTGSLGVDQRGPVGIRKVTMRDTDKVRDRNRRRLQRVLPEKVARTTTSILRSVLTIGTGKAANLGDVQAWGKTGTTENYGDAWFVGATDKLTVAVWVGYPGGLKAMTTEYRGQPVAGGTFPANIWHDFMIAAGEVDQTRLQRQCAADQRKLVSTPGAPAPASCVKAGLAPAPSEVAPAPATDPATATTPAPNPTDTTPGNGGAPAPGGRDPGGGAPETPPAPAPVPPVGPPPAPAPAPAPDPNVTTPSAGAPPTP
jgi:penicillin-binding protein 1A